MCVSETTLVRHIKCLPTIPTHNTQQTVETADSLLPVTHPHRADGAASNTRYSGYKALTFAFQRVEVCPSLQHIFNILLHDPLHRLQFCVNLGQVIPRAAGFGELSFRFVQVCLKRDAGIP